MAGASQLKEIYAQEGLILDESLGIVRRTHCSGVAGAWMWGKDRLGLRAIIVL